MRRSRRRMLRASLRDTKLLLSEFRTALAVFFFAIFGGATLYYFIAIQAGEPLRNFTEAVYLVLSLAFFQPPGDFPDSPYLEAFFFVMPLIGIGTLALGLADFSYLLFNRRARSKEWEMAIASTLENHHVLVGLGHLGFHILENETVGGIEDGYNASIILVRNDGKSNFHPVDAHPILANDIIAVLGRPDILHKLIHDSQ